MALGDLVTLPYQYEFNNFAFGSGTDYDIYKINGLLGYSMRSDSNDRFGRHGGSGARMYANMKNTSFEMRIRATSSTDYVTKRNSIATAMQPIVDPKDALYLVYRLDSNLTTKIITKCRPRVVDLDLDRAAALMYPNVKLGFEHLDPIQYGLTLNSQTFAMPSATNTINNSGNSITNWLLSMVGPATNPIITNNTTGQVISFTGLILNGTQVLTLDSSESTAKVNGESVDIYLTSGFSWWGLPVGGTSITVSATTATTASCTLTWRNGFWLP
jgi:hypothetical protein